MDSDQEEYRDLNLYLATAIEVAKGAGNLIRTHFESLQTARRQPELKQGNNADLVTLVDKEIEEYLREELTEKFPSHIFIGEEDAFINNYSLTDEPTWIVDPIDGTTNFVHGFPFVAVSIALVIKKETVVGVVYNPILNELYSASKDHGAYLNETYQLPLLQAAPISGFSDCLIGTEYGNDHLDSMLNAKMLSIHRMLSKGKARGVRCTGSGASGLCLIAKGALDIYWEVGLHVWDMAAGVLIVREAGGLCFGAGQNHITETNGTTGRAASPLQPYHVNGMNLDPMQTFNLMGRKVLAVRKIGNSNSISGKEVAALLVRDVVGKYIEDIEMANEGDQ